MLQSVLVVVSGGTEVQSVNAFVSGVYIGLIILIGNFIQCFVFQVYVASNYTY